MVYETASVAFVNVLGLVRRPIPAPAIVKSSMPSSLMPYPHMPLTPWYNVERIVLNPVLAHGLKSLAGAREEENGNSRDQRCSTGNEDTVGE